jgi:hypothetical protein
MLKWKKIGKIFDPREHELSCGCTQFAKAPQAYIYNENSIRVFFSACSLDNTGKYLSHICYVDFCNNFKNVINTNKTQVLTLGELGAFDEHGVFPIHIYQNKNELWGYTTGWSRRVSVSAESAIGLLVSRNNGKTFQKFGKGPIMAASLHEPFLVADPFVLLNGQVFHMWYISGKRWISSPEANQAERVYKISHATSDDGIHWKKSYRLIVPDSIGEDECQALPSVLEVDGIYHMVFCYRDAIGFRTEAGKGYRLGYAYSKDLMNWTRDDQFLGLELTGEGWDGQMMCYPHIFRLDGRIALLYNGNNFGKEGFGLAILDCDINERIKL